KRAPDNLAAIRGLAQLHDHPDESSYLDDDEDLRAQNHWRSLDPHEESSTEDPTTPAALEAEAADTVVQHAGAIDLDRFSPELPHTASAADVRPQLVRFGHADVEIDSFPPETMPAIE